MKSSKWTLVRKAKRKCSQYPYTGQPRYARGSIPSQCVTLAQTTTDSLGNSDDDVVLPCEKNEGVDIGVQVLNSGDHISKQSDSKITNHPKEPPVFFQKMHKASCDNGLLIIKYLTQLLIPC